MNDTEYHALLPSGDLWVFGYGSLMWRPGFAYREMHTARLYGYHRALCVWSWVHRGTRQCPGLVFGLDAGGSCVGRVFRVADKQKTADYLYQREMITPIYQPRLHRVRCAESVETALTFVVDRRHRQYASKQEAEQAAAVVCRARGQSGENRDYLINTVSHLQELGIKDHELEHLQQLVVERSIITDGFKQSY